MADKRVTSGGAMFNSTRPAVSKETQDLLKCEFFVFSIIKL